MKKMALFGAQGLLGMEAFLFFSEKYRLFPLSRGNLDLRRSDEIHDILDDLSPDIVLNAAGMTNVDDCERFSLENHQINTVAPEQMALWCQKNGAHFMHLSTDFVFSGERKNSDESSPKNPINAYGKAKSEAENRILLSCPNALIIRTARLYGKYKETFASWVLTRIKKKKPISAITDECGNYTLTSDIPPALEILLQEKMSGIVHLIGKESASPFQFSEQICLLMKSGITPQPLLSECLNRKAPRPKDTSLISTKIPLLRGFSEALLDFLPLSR